MNGVTAYLLMTNISPANWRAPVLPRPQVIGRLSACEIVIPSEHVHVSRRHASIESRQNQMWFRDLGSSGGSQLNGVPIMPDSETCVVVGDRLSLGGLELFLVSPNANVIKQVVSGTPDELQNARTSEHQAMGADASSDDPKSVSSFLDGRLYCLSPAELEVLQWFCRGLTVKEVSETLFRSPHTVKTQLNSIYKKLGVHSRAELLLFFKTCENAWTKSQISDSPTVKVKSPKPKPSSPVVQRRDTFPIEKSVIEEFEELDCDR